MVPGFNNSKVAFYHLIGTSFNTMYYSAIRYTSGVQRVKE